MGLNDSWIALQYNTKNLPQSTMQYLLLMSLFCLWIVFTLLMEMVLLGFNIV